jgi:ribosomal protein S18 acetylase RimI-like enzyme
MMVRAATVDDAPALGRVHVRAWQAAYRGQMPDEYLDGLSETERAAGWERGLSRSRERDPVLVAEEDGEVVGFVAIGPNRDGDADGDATGTGEVYAVNVDPDRWGQGAGRALLDAACHGLRGLGFARAVLWVLPDNARARRFYEAAGWRSDGVGRTQEVLGVHVDEVRYSCELTPR